MKVSMGARWIMHNLTFEADEVFPPVVRAVQPARGLLMGSRMTVSIEHMAKCAEKEAGVGVCSGSQVVPMFGSVEAGLVAMLGSSSGSHDPSKCREDGAFDDDCRGGAAVTMCADGYIKTMLTSCDERGSCDYTCSAPGGAHGSGCSFLLSSNVYDARL